MEFEFVIVWVMLFTCNIFGINKFHQCMKRDRKFQNRRDVFNLSFISKNFEVFGKTFCKIFNAFEITSKCNFIPPDFFNHLLNIKCKMTYCFIVFFKIESFNLSSVRGFLKGKLFFESLYISVRILFIGFIQTNVPTKSCAC